MDSKRNSLIAEDSIKKSSPLQRSTTLPTKQDSQVQESQDVNHKSESNQEASQSLAPPPRPPPQNGDTPDYFSGNHNGSHFSLEPNPFEREFGNPSAPTPNQSNETPGKSLLPGVATLTSPAPLLPGASAGFNWSNSLRAGPLSPAMLTGPTTTADYFNDFRAFPTPNESSLRTGLTPGGGGSMFPAPSPNTAAALFQPHLGPTGVNTPGTIDFQRTARELNTRKDIFNQQQNTTSAPHPTEPSVEQRSQPPTTQAEMFGPHDTHDAALTLSGLYSIAQSRPGAQGNNQFPVSEPTNNQPLSQTASAQMEHQSQESSPNLAKRAARNASLGGSISGVSAQGISEMSNDVSDSAEEQSRPNTRGKGKKTSASKNPQSTNTRRKAEETPSKAPAAKKAKGSNPNIDPKIEAGSSDNEDDHDLKQDHTNNDGKKMTDEEKRKNFLERNRVAALKCRQRKKQWLQNLQNKVELFSNENDLLTAQVTQLREEVVNLKTLLLAHKDCPISQAQGLGGLAMGTLAGSEFHHPNPHGAYGIPMQNGGPVMAQGMQRR
ncbi:MAG: hypothetical protein M1834_001441 [Cirrosporium novae-zelandiae]|nr:MAG: hypothetical protein M1834_001441 [Cirrosporium novae-zelandiae]